MTGTNFTGSTIGESCVSRGKLAMGKAAAGEAIWGKAAIQGKPQLQILAGKRCRIKHHIVKYDSR